jgi:kynurenine formamidase
MKTTIDYNQTSYTIDLSQPLDISLALSSNQAAASAWYCAPVQINPVMTEHFVGKVSEGGAVNFNDITFNPHGNGTHTECVGHISKEFYSINQVLNTYFFFARLLSIAPTQQGEDAIITLDQLKAVWEEDKAPQALIIRTIPNTLDKKEKQYTETNPPFVEAAAMDWLYKKGIRHFLIDTPSVDKEKDDGILAAHHAYWDYPNNPRLDATITELVYVPNEIEDDYYWLNLQVAALENDASPSRPVLYQIKA